MIYTLFRKDNTAEKPFKKIHTSKSRPAIITAIEKDIKKNGYTVLYWNELTDDLDLTWIEFGHPSVSYVFKYNDGATERLQNHRKNKEEKQDGEEDKQ